MAQRPRKRGAHGCCLGNAGLAVVNVGPQSQPGLSSRPGSHIMCVALGQSVSEFEIFHLLNGKRWVVLHHGGPVRGPAVTHAHLREYMCARQASSEAG